MIEGFEERLQDLERLVLKQAERIEALEEELTIMRHTARGHLLSQVKDTKTEAA